ncbi:hypothetical protein QFZ91_004599 [Paraburkholderia sp. JPY419]
MLRNDPRRVSAQVDGAQICAEYSELTGQLCLRQDGTLVREWFSTAFVDSDRVGGRRAPLGHAADRRRIARAAAQRNGVAARDLSGRASFERSGTPDAGLHSIAIALTLSSTDA